MVTGKATPKLTGLDTVRGAIDIIEQYFEHGWTDGLPIVPPTDVEEPGVLVPVVRSPDNILVLVAGDPARSRSAYCPARPYNRPVTKKVWLP